MKIAYRIITPIIALGSIAMGLFLKLFYFEIGGASDEISSIVSLIQQFGVNTSFEYSAFEIIQMLMGIEPSAEGSTESFMAVIEPILPHLIAFIVFFVIALLLFLAVGIVAAVTCNRKAVICMSAGGLVITFVCIVVARFAFDKLMAGEISLSDVVGMFSESTWAQLLTAVVSISRATLSAGFYAVFGMYIFTIIWTILVNMLIKTPIQLEKKHRRKKPLKSIKYLFNR